MTRARVGNRVGQGSTLAEVLPGSQFCEHHRGIVDAPREVVWDALLRLRWADLRLTRPLLAVRGLGAVILLDRVFETFTRRAGAVLTEETPGRAMLVMEGKPWSPVPRSVAVGSVDQARAFDRPGWLRYGMEWVLHPLPDGRTLVETWTRCEATDASARRAFGAYWAVVRPFSGLVRWDMIGALRRLTASPGNA